MPSLDLATGTTNHPLLECRFEHLYGGRTSQPLRGHIHPAPERISLPLRYREQVLAVYHNRRASGKAEPRCLLVGVHRHGLDFGVHPLGRKDFPERLLDGPVGRAPVEIQDLYLHPLRLLTLTPREVGYSSRVLPERRRPCSPSLWAGAARRPM